MKLKKYSEFIKCNENSSNDEIDNFLSKLDYINDNYYSNPYFEGGLKLITYDLSKSEDYRNDLNNLYESIESEIKLYDFDYHLIDIDKYKELIITIIPKEFIEENKFETFRFEDMKIDDRGLKIWRFRKELNDRFFSCVYGQYIRDFEIMTSEEEPFNATEIDTANLYFLDWQYKTKNNL